jgi:hypothetical protein
MTTALIIIWGGLALCLLPFLAVSLLASVWVSLDDPHEYH